MSGLDALPPLREVVRAHGLDARKSLGQNYLFDLNLTRKIARSTGPLGGVSQQRRGVAGGDTADQVREQLGRDVLVGDRELPRDLAPAARRQCTIRNLLPAQAANSTKPPLETAKY